MAQTVCFVFIQERVSCRELQALGSAPAPLPWEGQAACYGGTGEAGLRV